MFPARVNLWEAPLTGAGKAIDTIILGTGIGSITVVIMYSEKTFGWENLQVGISNLELPHTANAM